MPALSTLAPHQDLLKQQLPAWTHRIAASQWQRLKQSHVPAYFTQDWFANAAPDLREAVQRSQSRLLRSQATLARCGGLNKLPNSLNRDSKPASPSRTARHPCVALSCFG
ncbi:hypothetical protein [Pseudomonas sp. NFX1]|uniref:hypothetical protein n=1 Tax=Pseudomonas sp. NFX1 TaxID=2201355 RepID=UPI003DA75ABB